MDLSDRSPPVALRLAAAAVGLIVGATGAVVMHGVIASAGDAPVSSSTTTTTQPLPEWFHPAETLLGPTVLVPERLAVGGGALTLRYRLEPITPASAGPDERVDTAVLPDTWTLVTEAGEHQATTSPWTREVRFTVPVDFAAEGVREVRIDKVWVRSPFSAQLTVDLDEGPEAVVAPGISVLVIRTTGGESGSQAVASLEAEAGFAVSELAIESTDGSWLTSSMNQGASTRWTLSFTGPVPEPLPLLIRGIAWLPIESAAIVDIAGVPGA